MVPSIINEGLLLYIGNTFEGAQGVSRLLEMEPAFTFKTTKQQKALFGAVADYRIKKLVKCPTEAVIQAFQATL